MARSTQPSTRIIVNLICTTRVLYLFPLLIVIVHAQLPLPLPVSALITILEDRLANVVQQFGLVNAVSATAFNSPVQIPTNNTLGQPSLQDVHYYMYFSGAAYCYGSDLFNAWTCKYCEATGPNVHLYATLYNATTQVAGMINVNDVNRTIILTFRGSYAAQNFVVDLDFAAVPWAGVNPNVRVHEGFLGYLNSIYGQVRSSLLPLVAAHPDYKIVVGGHSLGSSLATLTLIRLLTTETEFVGRATDLSLFAYAPPRVGDVAFAQWANSLGFECARIVHYADVVPHIPPGNPSFGNYAHFGTEYWIDAAYSNHTRICRGDVLEDPDCSNSLAPVYDAIQHLSYYGVSPVECVIEDPAEATLLIL